MKALCRWEDKKADPNRYRLREGKREKVQRLVRSREDLVDIMYLTNPAMLDVAKIYKGSSLSGGVSSLNRSLITTPKFI